MRAGTPRTPTSARCASRRRSTSRDKPSPRRGPTAKTGSSTRPSLLPWRRPTSSRPGRASDSLTRRLLLKPRRRPRRRRRARATSARGRRQASRATSRRLGRRRRPNRRRPTPTVVAVHLVLSLRPSPSRPPFRHRPPVSRSLASASHAPFPRLHHAFYAPPFLSATRTTTDACSLASNALTPLPSHPLCPLHPCPARFVRPPPCCHHSPPTPPSLLATAYASPRPALVPLVFSLSPVPSFSRNVSPLLSFAPFVCPPREPRLFAARWAQVWYSSSASP